MDLSNSRPPMDVAAIWYADERLDSLNFPAVLAPDSCLSPDRRTRKPTKARKIFYPMPERFANLQAPALAGDRTSRFDRPRPGIPQPIAKNPQLAVTSHAQYRHPFHSTVHTALAGRPRPRAG